jgi:anti-sigma regulatory factor (Ser/Thr protein kinase)
MPHGDAEAIRSLIAEPYELDPASIETLAVFALQLTAKTRERLIFSALDELRSSTNRLNLTRFLQSMTERDHGFARTLRHATKPGGRCAAAARVVVSNALGTVVTSPAPQTSPIPEPRHGDRLPLGTEGELLLDPSTTSFYALPKLFHALSAAAHQGRDITIRIRDFVYASGLAIVATWVNARGGSSNARPEDGYTSAYLKRIGFYEALEGTDQPIAGDREDWSVRLTIIRPDARVQDVTARILEILDTFVHPSEEDRASFGILLGELIENVNRHAGARTPGFIVAQVYPKQYKLGITIADPGMGIKRSFIDGEVTEYKDWRKSDADFISLALKPLVTSKRSQHSGYGLYILAELIRRNGGTFSVSSGTHTVVGYRVRGHTVEKTTEHAAWPGTVVTMIISLQNKLPLGEVYNSLPLPAGYTDEDFFE